MYGEQDTPSRGQVPSTCIERPSDSSRNAASPELECAPNASLARTNTGASTACCAKTRRARTWLSRKAGAQKTTGLIQGGAARCDAGAPQGTRVR